MSKNITKLERQLLENVAYNDFADTPGDDVWSNCLHDCGPHKLEPTSVPGVASSLVKKGLLVSNGEVVRLTVDGLKILDL